jgi:hypothetical protein
MEKYHPSCLLPKTMIMQAGMRNARQQVFFRFLPERTGFEFALAGHAMLDPAPTSGGGGGGGGGAPPPPRARGGRGGVCGL